MRSMTDGPIQLLFTELAAQLQLRLLRGEHLTLYGPRGDGKSTLLMQLHGRLQRIGIPCAYSISTTTIDDSTRALERAYPRVNTPQVGRRTARTRLWSAADRHIGVLLLDHFRCNGSAMVSFLGRLHGKIARVLTAVDIESAREHERMRPWRYGAMSVRMTPASARQLRQLLDQRWRAARLPPLEMDAARGLIEAAHGRPGWIVACVELACERRYRRDHGPLLTVLCVDTEACARYQAFAMVRRESAEAPRAEQRVQESSPTADGSAVSGLTTPKRAGNSA